MRSNIKEVPRLPKEVLSNSGKIIDSVAKLTVDKKTARGSAKVLDIIKGVPTQKLTVSVVDPLRGDGDAPFVMGSADEPAAETHDPIYLGELVYNALTQKTKRNDKDKKVNSYTQDTILGETEVYYAPVMNLHGPKGPNAPVAARDSGEDDEPH